MVRDSWPKMAGHKSVATKTGHKGLAAKDWPQRTGHKGLATKKGLVAKGWPIMAAVGRGSRRADVANRSKTADERGHKERIGCKGLANYGCGWPRFATCRRCKP
jgi:hypothetical protein